MFSPRRLALALLIVALLFSAGLSAPASAVATAAIAFTDQSDQPLYQVTGTGQVDDGYGCDIVTMLMTDPTGGIVDADTFCLDPLTGIGNDFTDWGSHESLYLPTIGPITYTLYDTSVGNACTVDENSFACSDYLASGAVACLTEAYFQPPSLPIGTANAVCAASSAASVAGAGCGLSIPSGSVVGDAPFGAQVYWAPGKESPGVALKPGTYFVIGQDESETYYKTVLACQFVWVRKDVMQPSFQFPQNGAPLPARIVE